VLSDPGWALEAALDIQWAHAIAPRATILLVEAKTDELDAMMEAIDYAARRGAAVISNSWGTDEFSGEERYDKHCRLRSSVCVFASGNSGNPALYPAANPYAIAVGGTTLRLTAAGGVIDEVAWRGSGGGVSAYEPKPPYQNTVNSFGGRGAPDVSYNANPLTGFPVYDSFGYAGQSGWFRLGGTSVAAPQWAGIIAAADQLRASAGRRPLASRHVASHTALYALAGGPALYDVTAGSNGPCGIICRAGPGFDFVTGLGSPRPGIDAALAAALPDRGEHERGDDDP
jgi:subtilase family serine protease